MSAYVHQTVQQKTDTAEIERLLAEQNRILSDLYSFLVAQSTQERS